MRRMNFGAKVIGIAFLVSLSLMVGNHIAMAQRVLVTNKFLDAFVTADGDISISSGRQDLSFPQNSFLTVVINGKYYSNNPYAALPRPPDSLLPAFGHSTVLVGDTAITRFKNVNGVDLIQKVYPVDLGNYGQIVVRLEYESRTDVPIPIQAQFLLDLKIGNNDRPAILPGISTGPQLQTYTADSIPPAFVVFGQEFGPGFGSRGIGMYLTRSKFMQLLEPELVTYTDWQHQVDYLWDGAVKKSFGDAALLTRWPMIEASPKSHGELGSFSYGTSNAAVCYNSQAVVTYSLPPNQTLEEIKAQGSVEYPAIAAFLNMSSKPDSNVILNVDTREGGMLVAPYSGQSVYFSISSATPAYSGTPVELTFRTDGLRDLWYRVSALSNLDSVSGCVVPILLPKSVEEFVSPDTLAPVADSRNVGSLLTTSFLVHDSGPHDRGISYIRAFRPSDSLHFQVDVTPELLTCSPDTFLVSVTRSSISNGGCVRFVIMDCAGNITRDSVCVEPVLAVDVHQAEPSCSVSVAGRTAEISFPKLMVSGQFYVFDILGRIVRSEELGPGASHTRLTLPSSGTYFYSIRTSAAKYAGSFITTN